VSLLSLLNAHGPSLLAFDARLVLYRSDSFNPLSARHCEALHPLRARCGKSAIPAAAAAVNDCAAAEMRIAPSAVAVRAAAPVPTARACIGGARNRDRCGAREKNEPFHGETPFRSPAKRFANRPVPPFMVTKGLYEDRN